MEWLAELLHWTLDVIAAQSDTVLRLVLAAALGGMIGLEREASGKPAGFRTNLLICVGAALLTELSRYISATADPALVRADPGRIAAQVVSGIGFLGAGTIMQSRGAVTGLTTAATLWVVAAIGMAIGAEAYIPAMVTTALVMGALRMLGRIEDTLLPRRSSERTLELSLDPAAPVTAVQDLLAASSVMVLSLTVERSDAVLNLTFQTRAAVDRYDRAVNALLNQPAIRRLSLF
jgi:putative Mg2+ transporter-C (MgtC) family protein